MEKTEKLFKDACLRCESHAKNMTCEDMNNCPVYGLYLIAKGKKKIVYKQDVWSDPPTPRPEMI